MIAEGTPEEVARVKGSYTGQFLAPFLAKSLATKPKKSGEKTVAANPSPKLPVNQ